MTRATCPHCAAHLPVGVGCCCDGSLRATAAGIKPPELPRYVCAECGHARPPGSTRCDNCTAGCSQWERPLTDAAVLDLLLEADPARPLPTYLRGDVEAVKQRARNEVQRLRDKLDDCRKVRESCLRAAERRPAGETGAAYAAAARWLHSALADPGHPIAEADEAERLRPA